MLDGFKVITRIASTRHSAVYLAERIADQRRCVLKVFQKRSDGSDNLDAYERFLAEYSLVASVEHPNVVRIFDHVIGDDRSFIVMEYLGGGTLRHRIARGIGEREALGHLKAMASALTAVHRVGILHRDLKPANVMFRDDGSLALIDFGLAMRMRLQLALTDTGDILGTPYYMSPEQGHGRDMDQRSDIYSLGVIFFEMLAGRRPYEGDSALGIIYKHAREPVPLLPQRVAHYQVLINMMMAKKPSDRIQTAEEIVTWL